MPNGVQNVPISGILPVATVEVVFGEILPVLRFRVERLLGRG